MHITLCKVSCEVSYNVAVIIIFVLLSLPISSGAFPTNLLRARWMSQIIAGSIEFSFTAGTSRTSSRDSSLVASIQCCSCSTVRSFWFKSWMEFGGVESEQEVGVVVFGVCVLLLCAVDLGMIGVWDGLVLLDGPESFDRQPEILRVGNT